MYSVQMLLIKLSRGPMRDVFVYMNGPYRQRTAGAHALYMQRRTTRYLMPVLLGLGVQLGL